MVTSLKQIITDTLTPLITNDYIYLELPYHNNIGDVLIWKGTKDFLKKLPYRCLYYSSLHTYSKPTIAKNVIIILHGGGNFGDLWKKSADSRLKILNDFPDNKIIILPQTVFYLNTDTLLSDADIFNRHKDLIICVRDKISYQIVCKYIPNSVVYLIPDMAFCISVPWLKKYQTKQTNKVLLLKRTDKELNNSIDYPTAVSEKEFDIHDWPTMEKTTVCCFLLRCFLWANKRIPSVFRRLTDIYASIFFRTAIIKIGVRFVSKYRKIYTTRLHTAILCCLLETPCVLFDNSYGKNNNFYETWLHGFDGIEYFKYQEE
jgi:pyruvyl transferase EpsO